MASVAIKKEEQGNYQIPVQRGLRLCASVERSPTQTSQLPNTHPALRKQSIMSHLPIIVSSGLWQWIPQRTRGWWWSSGLEHAPHRVAKVLTVLPSSHMHLLLQQMPFGVLGPRVMSAVSTTLCARPTDYKGKALRSAQNLSVPRQSAQSVPGPDYCSGSLEHLWTRREDKPCSEDTKCSAK